MKSKTEMVKGKTLCPSSRPEVKSSVILGIAGGTPAQPVVRILEEPIPMPALLADLLGEIHPTEVFRFASPCACGACRHFENERCGIARRVVERLDHTQGDPPECPIRSDCRWWKQEGVAACLRCSQVVTDTFDPTSPTGRVLGKS